MAKNFIYFFTIVLTAEINLSRKILLQKSHEIINVLKVCVHIVLGVIYIIFRQFKQKP